MSCPKMSFKSESKIMIILKVFYVRSLYVLFRYISSLCYNCNTSFDINQMSNFTIFDYFLKFNFTKIELSSSI